MGQTMLHCAVKGPEENLALVTFLVSQGLHFLQIDTHGNTCLHYAIATRKFTIVQYFLLDCSHATKPPQKDLRRTLFEAAKANESRIIELLETRWGVDIWCTNRRQRSVLHEASSNGADGCVEVLLRSGRSKIHARDDLGASAVIEASRNGHLGVLHKLLEAGGRYDDIDLEGRTALHYASERGHTTVVCKLLKHGADVNCRDKHGWTPLHAAAAEGRVNVVKQLLAWGSEVAAATELGKTALLLAVERGQSAIVQCLMSRHDAALASMLQSPQAEVLTKYKNYFLASADTVLEPSGPSDEGFWLGAPIELKRKRRPQNFRQELDRWSSLNHPHTVKLFGVCQVENGRTPFFVYERPVHGSLLAYRKELEQATVLSHTWAKLYEASLGLQYLHDRNIIHGNLRCESIAVAGNEVAKLRNLGGDRANDDRYVSWTAPEVLSGLPRSFEGDIFAFGMTIVEAVKNGNPWGPRYSRSAIRNSIQAHKLPDKPAEMTMTQWQLVERMCFYKPEDRPTASDIVRELQVFAGECDALRRSEELNVSLFSWSKLGDVMVDYERLDKLLVRISLMCSFDIFSWDVFNRLLDAFKQLKAREGVPSEALVKRYSSILLQLCSRLERTSAVGPIRFAASRQVAGDAFTVHARLDVFMEAAQLSGSSKVHNWRQQWEYQRRKLVRELLEKAQNWPKNANNVTERNEFNASLCLELSKYPTRYTARTPNDIASTRPSPSAPSTPANWYIPSYEVEFNSTNELGRGAFGSVYKGKWKNAQIVVKKLEMEEGKEERTWGSLSGDSLLSEEPRARSLRTLATFLNEVEIWHQLFHPNVVQLYGACHFGKPFFVCEYAGRGQLDKYLKVHPDEVWMKLHEAALGLRYLHFKNIVHCDLKCNNILIGSDGRAKLNDFGLSTLRTYQRNYRNDMGEVRVEPQIGAVRWKAPEVLSGGKPTFASDIYSFGMCILEAVSGKWPWGMLVDDAVKYHVLEKEKIPDKPANCSQEAYMLVQEMCKFKPEERPNSKDVADALKRLHEDASRNQLS